MPWEACICTEELLLEAPTGVTFIHGVVQCAPVLSIEASLLRINCSRALQGCLGLRGDTSLSCSTKSERRSGCGTIVCGRRRHMSAGSSGLSYSWQAPSSRDGRERDHAVSLGVSGVGACECINLESGALCAALSV